MKPGGFFEPLIRICSADNLAAVGRVRRNGSGHVGEHHSHWWPVAEEGIVAAHISQASRALSNARCCFIGALRTLESGEPPRISMNQAEFPSFAAFAGDTRAPGLFERARRFWAVVILAARVYLGYKAIQLWTRYVSARNKPELYRRQDLRSARALYRRRKERMED